MRFTLVPWSLDQKHSFNLFHLPGGIQPWAAVALQWFFYIQYQPRTAQVPIYYSSWREVIIVKHLAQGHKCHDRDLNPHSADLTTRTWIWCFNQLSFEAKTNLSLSHFWLDIFFPGHKERGQSGFSWDCTWCVFYHFIPGGFTIWKFGKLYHGNLLSVLICFC